MLLTITKIGPVLDLFTADQSEWGVSEVAAETGMPKSTAHAVLSSLVDVGLLACTSRSRYRLGWRCLALGESLRASLDLRRAALPVMRELVRRYGETVHLGVLDRGRVLYLERLEGTNPVHVTGPRLGARWPAHGSALGKVMLASRPPGEVRALLRVEGLPPLTSNTITRHDALETELGRVRAQGWAYDQEETIQDVSCVAAPIVHDRGMVVAALSTSVPAARFRLRRDALREALVAAAAHVSRELARVVAPAPVRAEQRRATA